LIKHAVAFLLTKGRDQDDVVAVAVGLIVYGVTTEEELQDVADYEEEFARRLTADKYGIPAAICDLLFAKYVAVAIGAAPSLAELARLKRERDAAAARAETAEDIAGLAPQSLWDSKWHLAWQAHHVFAVHIGLASAGRGSSDGGPDAPRSTSNTSS
jgi:hypothetical protein